MPCQTDPWKFPCNTHSRIKTALEHFRPKRVHGIIHVILFYSSTKRVVWKFPCNSDTSIQNIIKHSCQKQVHGNFHATLNHVYEIIRNILG